MSPPRADKTSTAAGSVPGRPVAVTVPSLTATQPPGIGSPASVTSSSLSRTRRSTVVVGGTSEFYTTPDAASRTAVRAGLASLRSHHLRKPAALQLGAMVSADDP